MGDNFTLDTSKLNDTVVEALKKHESSTWPGFLNKRMYFVSKAAIPETPKVLPEIIESDLTKLVYTRQGGGPPRQVELGYALASKRASEGWTSSKRFLKIVKRNRAGGRGATPEMEAAAWEAEIKAQRGRITGARKAAAGFLRLGWLYVMKLLGPSTGLSYYPSVGEVGARMRGINKGVVNPASEGRLTVSAMNSAHASSETRGGFHRIGDPALQRAMDNEASELRRHLEEEMEPHIQDFNRKQH